MFDQYVSWIDPWIVEALAVIIGSFVLVFVICRIMDFLNGDQQ